MTSGYRKSPAIPLKWFIRSPLDSVASLNHAAVARGAGRGCPPASRSVSRHAANATTAASTTIRRIREYQYIKKAGLKPRPTVAGTGGAKAPPYSPALQLIAGDDEVALLRALGDRAAEDLVVD